MSRRAIFVLLGSAVFLGSVAFLVICQSGRYSVSGEDLSVSDEDRLRARFQEFLAAIDADDVEAVYSMYPPLIRQQLTLEEYKEKRLEGLEEYTGKMKEEPPSLRVDDFEKICSCGAIQTIPLGRICALLVSATLVDPEGREAKIKVLESWVQVEGEWYYVYTDHHKVDGCP